MELSLTQELTMQLARGEGAAAASQSTQTNYHVSPMMPMGVLS
jgi:hypothetical protein